jgi:hypothetical protein
MSTSTPETLTPTPNLIDRIKAALGIVPGNPLNIPIIVSVLLTVILYIGLLIVVLFGGSTETKYAAGMVFILVALLFPMFIMLLLIPGRNYARILQIPAGDYWIHWTYDDADRNRWKHLLPKLKGTGREVYISQQGIYWADRKFRLEHFASGLTGIEIVTAHDQPAMIKFSYFRRQYQNVGPLVFPSYADPKETLVPIPNGHETEAEDLVNGLKARFIGVPSDATNDQWVLVWWWIGSVVVGLILVIVLMLPLEFTRTDEKYDAQATQYAATRQADQAIIEAVFPSYQGVIERQLPTWIKNHEKYFRYLTPQEAGFAPEDNVSQVVVGYCEDGYAVLILQRTPSIDPVLGQVSGFAYTTSENSYTCLPPYWEMGVMKMVDGNADDGWFYTSFSTYRATLVPHLTELAPQLNPILTGTPDATP